MARKATQQDTTVRNLRADRKREERLTARVEALEAAQRQTVKLLRELARTLRAVAKAR